MRSPAFVTPASGVVLGPEAPLIAMGGGVGVLAVLAGAAIRRVAVEVQGRVDGHRLLPTPLVGAAIAVTAIVFAEATGRSSSEVLFSGQTALPSLIEQAGSWTAGALVAPLLSRASPMPPR